MGGNITPIGRIVVFKSLILSKIIHLLQSLPSPSKTLFKQIEKLAYNFIWRNKRHQVNRTILSLDIENGGLKMFDVIEFDMSLKITWLYKLLNPDNKWLEFALAGKIDRLIWTGESYHNKLLEATKKKLLEKRHYCI